MKIVSANFKMLIPIFALLTIATPTTVFADHAWCLFGPKDCHYSLEKGATVGEDSLKYQIGGWDVCPKIGPHGGYFVFSSCP